MRWAIVALAVADAGWMAFDGTRALIVGDYVTVDGELGPWTALVEAVRIEPRSTFMKSVFAVYGVAWLVVAAFFAHGARWARRGMLLAAAGSLWYLVVGTASSALQIVLLLVLDWSERRGKPNPTASAGWPARRAPG